MIAVVDVCSGNLRSVERALAHVGGDVVVTRDANVVRRADKIVVPGQGAFGVFMRELVARDLGPALREVIASGRPYLGICLGMQIAIVEYGRHMLGLNEANSTEFNRATPHPVIALISEWQDQAQGVQVRDESTGKGATMRLGAQEVLLGAGTRAREIYGKDSIAERHRHRYEFNNNFMERFRTSGLRFSGFSRDGLVEMIELPSHPWFVASQFHPEFTSTPRDGHPLFTSFVRAARAHRAAELPQAAGA